uniref:helix-turn-helix domain-containing protein n=1 Tax=Nonomuraea bangladeshensis TaxID=404385 RepID=UPI003F492CBE
MQELSIQDTLGILTQPWIRPLRTSAGLGWEGVYLSTQAEQPYRNVFGPAPSHLLILHLDNLVTVRRRRRGLSAARQIPPGGLFLHPAHTTLEVELGGRLRTVHVYLSDETLQSALAENKQRPVRMAEEFGVFDPLLEQLVLTLDGVVRDGVPTSRTYADQLVLTLAAQLALRHSDVPQNCVALPPRTPGLTDRQFAAVRELMDTRLSAPLSLEDLAAAANLSVRQFARAFKARTGQPPHRFLMRLRVEHATRLLRSGSLPIAEVAALSGFSHQEHLSRVLRTWRGTTPAALRRGD